MQLKISPYVSNNLNRTKNNETSFGNWYIPPIPTAAEMVRFEMKREANANKTLIEKATRILEETQEKIKNSIPINDLRRRIIEIIDIPYENLRFSIGFYGDRNQLIALNSLSSKASRIKNKELPIADIQPLRKPNIPDNLTLAQQKIYEANLTENY